MTSFLYSLSLIFFCIFFLKFLDWFYFPIFFPIFYDFYLISGSSYFSVLLVLLNFSIV